VSDAHDFDDFDFAEALDKTRILRRDNPDLASEIEIAARRKEMALITGADSEEDKARILRQRRTARENGSLEIPFRIADKYPHLVTCFPISVGGNSYVLDEDGKLCLGLKDKKVICTPIYPVQVYRDIVTGKKWVTLTWLSGAQVIDLTIPLGLTARKDTFISTLADHGLLIAGRAEENNLRLYLTDMIPFAPEVPVTYASFGWHSDIGLPAWHETDLNAIPYMLYDSNSYTMELHPLRAGDKNLSLATIFSFIDSIPLIEVLCGAAYFSMVAADKVQFRHTLPTILFRGERDSGKTIALEIITSLFGPQKFKHTANRTENNFYAKCINNGRIPVIYDEASNKNRAGANDANTKAVVELIKLAQGLGKGRCDRNGNPLPEAEWECLHFFSGNYELTSNHMGEEVRLIPIQFTKDVFANDLANMNYRREKLYNNYGFAAPIFYAYYLQHKDDYNTYYTQHYKYICDKYPDWSPKHQNYMSGIFAACQMARYAFKGYSELTPDTPLQIDAIAKYLYIDDTDSDDGGTTLGTIKETLDDWIAINRPRIVKHESVRTKDTPSSASNWLCGAYEIEDEGLMCFIPTVFDEATRNIGLQRSSITRLLYDNNLLKVSIEKNKKTGEPKPRHGCVYRIRVYGNLKDTIAYKMNREE